MKQLSPRFAPILNSSSSPFCNFPHQGPTYSNGPRTNPIPDSLLSESEKSSFLERLTKLKERRASNWSANLGRHPRWDERMADRVHENKENRRFAVFVPLIEIGGRSSLLFTQRSYHLTEHRGQVSFPGGGVDAGETLVQAALREAHEEIGLQPNDVDVWAELHPVLTRALQNTVTPVLGRILPSVELSSLTPHEAEVREVFTVALDDLTNPKNVHHTQFRHEPGHKRVGQRDHDTSEGERKRMRHGEVNGYSLPVFTAGPHKIWGLTAAILHQLLPLLVPDRYRISRVPYVRVGSTSR